MEFFKITEKDFLKFFSYSGRASSTLEGTPKAPQARPPPRGAQAYRNEPPSEGGRSSLGLGKYYQDMSKNFYKSNLGNRNFFKVLKIFLL